MSKRELRRNLKLRFQDWEKTAISSAMSAGDTAENNLIVKGNAFHVMAVDTIEPMCLWVYFKNDTRIRFLVYLGNLVHVRKEIGKNGRLRGY